MGQTLRRAGALVATIWRSLEVAANKYMDKDELQLLLLDCEVSFFCLGDTFTGLLFSWSIGVLIER